MKNKMEARFKLHKRDGFWIANLWAAKLGTDKQCEYRVKRSSTAAIDGLIRVVDGAGVLSKNELGRLHIYLIDASSFMIPRRGASTKSLLVSFDLRMDR